MPNYEKMAKFFYDYLNQGAVWFDKRGQRNNIPEMAPVWRWFCARWLVNHARHYEFYYSLGEIDFLFTPRLGVVVGHEEDGEPTISPTETFTLGPTSDMAEDAYNQATDERMENPKEWIKTTELYRALLDGLPPDVEEMAKHRVPCPMREDLKAGPCTCGGAWRLKGNVTV